MGRIGPPRRRRRAGVAVGAAALVVGGVLAVRALTTDPVLLDARDFDHVRTVVQDGDGDDTPGTTWCAGMSLTRMEPVPLTSTLITLDDGGTVGATLLGDWSQDVVRQVWVQADLCERTESGGRSWGRTIEPVTGLGDGIIGWRTEQPGSGWGEIAFVAEHGGRALAVGLTSPGPEAEAPVTLSELIDLAREGVEQFPPGDG